MQFKRKGQEGEGLECELEIYPNGKAFSVIIDGFYVCSVSTKGLRRNRCVAIKGLPCDADGRIIERQ